MGAIAELAMIPAATALTRTRGARSAALIRVQCRRAAFAVPYATMPRAARSPYVEEMLTTDGPRPSANPSAPASSAAARRCGSAACVSRCAVDTLKWNARSSTSTDVSVNGAGIAPPTSLTTMSRRPRARAVDSASAATASSSDRSAMTTCTRRPRVVTRLATSARSAAVLALTATSAPASASDSAVATARPRRGHGAERDAVGKSKSIEDHVTSGVGVESGVRGYLAIVSAASRRRQNARQGAPRTSQ